MAALRDHTHPDSVAAVVAEVRRTERYRGHLSAFDEFKHVRDERHVVREDPRLCGCQLELDFLESNRADNRALTQHLERGVGDGAGNYCLLYTSPSPRDRQK